MSLQSTRTKALADTLSIANDGIREQTVDKVNTLGEHLMNELRVAKWTEKDNNVLRYIQALVAVSPPSI